jgi:RND family efflux transporter MFP subunit
MRPTFRLFACAVLICLVLTGCQEEHAAETQEPRAARVITAKLEKRGAVAQGAGRIEARHVSQVGFEIGGRLLSRHVEVGDVVRKGQQLAEVSATDFENKLAAAEAEVAAAKAAFIEAAAQERRKHILLEKGVVEAAEANLRIAQNQLNYTRLLATDDGVVTATGADPGQVIAAGQMIVEISNDAEKEAVFAVSADHAAHARPGIAVNIWLQGKPELTTTGAIREISPQADSATGTYGVKVSLPSPLPDMRLGAVVVGRVELQGDQVVSLPSAALLQSGGKPQVWIVAEDGKVRRRDVELAKFDDDSVAIRRGVEAGEKVVVAGVNTLADGQAVKPAGEAE